LNGQSHCSKEATPFNGDGQERLDFTAFIGQLESMKNLKRILIANRGEIAVRIIKTVKKMGLTSIVVYSDADRNSLAVKMADESIHIGGSSPSQSYLNIPAIVEACLKTGADAVHPGYGFLSENESFARALEENGIVFIGPTPETISAMGNKIEARRIMEAHGVPVVPGNNDLPSDPAAIASIASEIGYPLLVKARAGGGGRGMRLIQSEKELMDGIQSARREAASAFADDGVFLEKFVETPRHIEIQIFGDGQGNCIHLFERECSIQRRHQKIIEESPSPALGPSERASITEAALKAGRAVNYRGAGTVEFVYSDSTRSFYFLEMNTRLQVEHPVTEEVTGRDLVRDQILVAMDPSHLPDQREITQKGHSMEVRLYAEDPSEGFIPSAGKIHRFKTPSSLRVDTGVESGSEVSLFYDPMIAKIIATGSKRAETIANLRQGLDDVVLFGPRSNLEYLKSILENPQFQSGDFSTAFIEKEMSDWKPTTSESTLERARAALAVLYYEGAGKRNRARTGVWASDSFQLWQKSLAAEKTRA
tara:strand:- start:85950 stop:87560 length:1611 start_codon:yes stop_codon:yes gene_type:complete